MLLNIPPALAVFIGGGVGSLLRWWISMKLNPLNHLISLGTLSVNVIGAILIGGMIAYLESSPNVPSQYKLFIVTGLCGGLTTFSTFSLEVFQQLQNQNWLAAGGMICLNVFMSIVFVAISYFLTIKIIT